MKVFTPLLLCLGLVSALLLGGCGSAEPEAATTPAPDATASAAPGGAGGAPQMSPATPAKPPMGPDGGPP